MAAVDDFDEVLEPYHQALGEIINGNPYGYRNFYSHRGDVTLANPFGPPARGWDEVAKTLEGAASHYRDGELTGFETVAKYVTPELAYLVRDGAVRGQGWRKGGCHPGYPTGYEHLSARGWHLEACASARRPHNHPSASRVGDTGVDLSLERTSENCVKRKFNFA